MYIYLCCGAFVCMYIYDIRTVHTYVSRHFLLSLLMYAHCGCSSIPHTVQATRISVDMFQSRALEVSTAQTNLAKEIAEIVKSMDTSYQEVAGCVSARRDMLRCAADHFQVHQQVSTVDQCVCVCVHACVRACMRACVCACMRACLCICVHIRTCVCTCVFIRMSFTYIHYMTYVYTYVQCMCTYMKGVH